MVPIHPHAIEKKVSRVQSLNSKFSTAVIPIEGNVVSNLLL